MITIYRGDNARLTGAVTDQDGAVIDITGWTIVLSAAQELGDEPIWQLDAVIDTPTDGTFYFDLDPETHTGNVRDLVYDVEAMTVAGKIHTLEVGEISIIQEVGSCALSV